MTCAKILHFVRHVENGCSGVKGVEHKGKEVKLQRARVLAARNPKLILRRSGLWLRNAHRK
jgi:hypothetical protein